MLPSERTMKYLRSIGVPVGKTEYWQAIPKSRNPAGGVRKDLFTFIDLIALYPGRIVAIQATSRGSMSARAAKIKAEPLARKWMESGGEILIYGWNKRKHGKCWRWWPHIKSAVLSGDEIRFE